MNKTIRNIVALILMGLSLAGCSLLQPTPYQPYGVVGGYKDVQLTPHVYQVYFSGNNRTPFLQMGNYLLRRSGELTREKGYHYFAVLSFGINGVGLGATGKTLTIRLLADNVAKDILARQARDKVAEILVFNADAIISSDSNRNAAQSLLYQANFVLARKKK